MREPDSARCKTVAEESCVTDNGGQEAARYAEVLRQYWPNVVRYVGRMLGWNHPDVEDLAQRTLETAWQKR